MDLVSSAKLTLPNKRNCTVYTVVATYSRYSLLLLLLPLLPLLHLLQFIDTVALAAGSANRWPIPMIMPASI